MTRAGKLVNLGALVVPFLATLAAIGLLWGGLVRTFFVHHVTWSVNSVCNFLGSRRFEVDDRYHNHHAFPRSAVHGLHRWELDPSAAAIAAMERLGRAWNLIRVSPERQSAKAQAPS